MKERVLIAGVGNIFFGDDGYGCEVARRLASEPFEARVRVEDYGIRGTHLAFELMSGYAGAILIDAVSRGGEPGTLYVIEPDLEAPGGTPDAHSMDLQNVFAFMRTLDGTRPRVILIGCEVTKPREEMGLSEAVEQAVGNSLPVVREVLAKHFSGALAPVGEHV
ncbi:MAG: hydrogenase maturation protease [Candidatus Eremiobacteraeota bacterium]|nr:hydrogenase maturation protease [Candidatus Eremiobacteraeota bacterium]